MSHSYAPTRRTLLRKSALAGATAAAAGVGVLGAADGADAARYRPRRHHGEPLLPPAQRHLVTRFSYGVTPKLTRQVRAAGGADTWFEQQLRPTRIADRATDGLLSWWPSLTRGPQELGRRQETGVEGGWEVMADYQRWLLVRRITSNRQVHEVMTEFWMNHFNVPVHSDAVFTYRFDYDTLVRRHALGRFEDLLQGVTTHPAMGLYLSNAVSTKKHPNENLGRELLELHTVGRGTADAPTYGEDDVKASARILTGYLVDEWDTWEAAYSPDDHWTGPVKVMDFESPNTVADGRAVTRSYLSYLAHHPATARRVARKLAVKFVGDNPSSALVDRLAKVYLDNDTAIAPVLRALIGSAEFKRSAGGKVRDPAEDVVATYRALGVRLRQPPRVENDHAATAILWQTDTLGATPHDWPRPDGQPIDNDSWASPGRLLASLDLHWVMSGGWWPKQGIDYRTPARWLPAKRVRFDELVDHVSQRLLGRVSTSELLRAACEVCQVRPSDVITAQHGLVKWNFQRLLSTVLDSPTHLTR